MWYSIVISVLLVICLVLYFVFSRKLKMPTVATEIMTSKYNKKLNKLERFCKSNKLQFDKAKYLGKTVESELTNENLISNIQTIQNIAFNFEEIEDVFISSKKEEAQNKINSLKQIAPLKIFAGELKWDKTVVGLFDTFNADQTKLNFEFQKYLGSQNFIKNGEQKLFFLSEDKLLIVDERNIFESKIVDCNLEVRQIENSENSDTAKVFNLKLSSGSDIIFNKEVLADKESVCHYLTNNKYYKK